MIIKVAENDDEFQSCFPVIAELRPHLRLEDFLSQIKRQTKQTTFYLIYLIDDEEVKAVGTIRLGEWLASGKYLEIEDLATKSSERSKGYGGRLFDWIREFAKKENCRQLRLVSHVKRFDAHRFYLNKEMLIEAHYFSITL